MTTTTTLLQACQRVARRALLPQPTSIFNNAFDDNADAIREAAQFIGDETARYGERAGWPELQRRGQVVGAMGDDGELLRGFRLPDDFLRIVPETIWNATNRYAVDGPVSPEEEAAHIDGLLKDTGYNPRFYFGPNDTGEGHPIAIYFAPRASVGERLTFEYISRFWIRKGGTGPDRNMRIEFFDADDNEIILDRFIMEIGILAEYKKVHGIDSAIDWANYEQERGKRMVESLGNTITIMGRYNRPEGAFGFGARNGLYPYTISGA